MPGFIVKAVSSSVRESTSPVHESVKYIGPYIMECIYTVNCLKDKKLF